MNSHRDGKGRYSGKSVKRAAKLLVFGLIVFGSWFWVGPLLEVALHGNEVQAANAISPEALAKVIIGKDIEGLKDGVVADIEKCESGGDYGIIIFDSNNEASVGGLQYQRKTVQHYVKKFDGGDISKAEAISLAIDREKARALGKEIIFQEVDGWRNWFNCGVKVNAGARVAAIKSLMQ